MHCNYPINWRAQSNQLTGMRTILDLLTPKELIAARLVREAYANKEIARRLNTTVDTVKQHLNHIYMKLGIQGDSNVSTRVYLAIRVEREIQQNLLPEQEIPAPKEWEMGAQSGTFRAQNTGFRHRKWDKRIASSHPKANEWRKSRTSTM